MKAINITAAQIDALATKYEIAGEDKVELLPVGHILVTDFGDDNLDYSVVTVAIFNANFVLTNVTLKNGFYEVERN